MFEDKTEKDEIKAEIPVKPIRDIHIDMLRCIACFAVVGLHTIGRNYSTMNMFLYYSCGFAVPSFFMAMGYIQLNSIQKPYKYYLKRCGAILIIVFFWNTVEYVLETVNSLLSGEELITDISEPFRMTILSLLQRGSLDKFWFFGSTIIIYLLIPLLNTWDNEKKKNAWILCLASSLLVFAISILDHKPVQAYVIQTFRLWTWIQYLLLGWMLSYWKENYKSIHINTSAFILLSVAVVTVHILLGTYCFNRTEAEWFYDDPLQILWLVSIFLFFMSRRLNRSIAKVITWISPLTMGVYIIHSVLIRIMWVFISVDNATKAIVSWIVIFILSVFVSWVIKKTPVFWRTIKL